MEPVEKVTPLTRAANTIYHPSLKTWDPAERTWAMYQLPMHYTQILHYKLNYDQESQHCAPWLFCNFYHTQTSMYSWDLLRNRTCSLTVYILGLFLSRGAIPTKPSLLQQPMCSSLECSSLRQGGVPQRVQGQFNEGMEENIRASSFFFNFFTDWACNQKPTGFLTWDHRSKAQWGLTFYETLISAD